MSITRKIADAAEYMAQVPKFSWTIGEIIPKITNGEFKPHVMQMNRGGRLVERAIFVAGMTAGVAGCLVEQSLFPMLLIVPLTKMAGYMGGGVSHYAADKFADVAQGLDRRATALGRMFKNTPKNAVGATNGNPAEVKAQRRALKDAQRDLERQRQKNKPGLFDKGILNGMTKAMDWLNEESPHKYTIGEGLRRLVGKEPSPYGFHGSRLGRLTERVVTIGMGVLPAASLVACLVVGAPFAAPLGMLIVAKVTGVIAGAGVHFAGKIAGGMLHSLDRALSRGKPEGVGARSAEQKSAKNTQSSRPAPQMQPEGPGSTLSQRSISEEFQRNAQRTAPGDGVAYSPLGPRARENFNFDSVTDAARPQQPRQQQGQRM